VNTATTPSFSQSTAAFARIPPLLPQCIHARFFNDIPQKMDGVRDEGERLQKKRVGGRRFALLFRPQSDFHRPRDYDWAA
jgi:hypothetical protein